MCKVFPAAFHRCQKAMSESIRPSPQPPSASGTARNHGASIFAKAEARNTAWAAKTPHQQLQYLDAHNLVAKRQRERIAKCPSKPPSP